MKPECTFIEGDIVSVKKVGCARVTGKFIRYYPKKDDCRVEVAANTYIFAKLKYVTKTEEVPSGQETKED